jgi:pyrroline-5-carboxylate reductase
VTVWVDDESLLDTVTALSGSGPAYFFLLMEALEQASVALGLDADTARLLTLQTAFGAAKMALESAESPATLRVRVTSPGGTTEQALTILRDGGMEPLVVRALEAARHRSVELGDLLGGQP